MKIARADGEHVLKTHGSPESIECNVVNVYPDIRGHRINGMGCSYSFHWPCTQLDGRKGE